MGKKARAGEESSFLLSFGAASCGGRKWTGPSGLLQVGLERKGEYSMYVWLCIPPFTLGPSWPLLLPGDPGGGPVTAPDSLGLLPALGFFQRVLVLSSDSLAILSAGA
jgi:hypothetical protein